MSPETLQQRFRNDEIREPLVTGLRLRDTQARPRHLCDAFSDRDLPEFQVEVTPSQSCKLGAAKSERDVQYHRHTKDIS
jgi:hypothetical protein